VSVPTRIRLTNRVHRPAFLNHSARFNAERARAQQAKRDPVAQALYATREWKTLRAQVLRESNGRCATKNCARAACIVDHVRPHRGINALFFDRDNLQALCKRCHDRKTARYDGSFGRAPRAAYPREKSAHIAPQPVLDGGRGDGGGT
jgi:5-methylcytosine-specific restriction enzyme A